MELVSIIVPVYNTEKFIYETISSIINQTYENFEIIVIDDCCTDKSIQIIEQFNNSKITIIKNEKNLGVADSRNKGIHLAQGKYIAFLDADDFWEKEKLEVQVKYLEENDKIHLCATSYKLIDESSNIIDEYNLKNNDISYNKLLMENVIGLSSVVGRSDIIKKYTFNNKFKHEDLVLWLQLLKDGYCINTLSTSLMRYRVVKGSRSNNKLKSAYNKWLVLVKSEKINVFTSFYYMIIYIIKALYKYKKIGTNL